jgi:hypothetical protein
MPTGFFIWGYMYPFTFILGGTSKFVYCKTMVGQTQRPWVSQNPTSCLTQCQTEKKVFRQLCVIKDKADMANNPYLMVRSRSEYYTSMSVSGLPTFLISVKNMNLLSSSIYKHLKTYLVKHKHVRQKKKVFANSAILVLVRNKTWTPILQFNKSIFLNE